MCWCLSLECSLRSFDGIRTSFFFNPLKYINEKQEGQPANCALPSMYLSVNSVVTYTMSRSTFSHFFCCGSPLRDAKMQQTGFDVLVVWLSRDTASYGRLRAFRSHFNSFCCPCADLGSHLCANLGPHSNALWHCKPWCFAQKRLYAIVFNRYSKWRSLSCNSIVGKGVVHLLIHFSYRFFLLLPFV